MDFSGSDFRITNDPISKIIRHEIITSNLQDPLNSHNMRTHPML